MSTPPPPERGVAPDASGRRRSRRRRGRGRGDRPPPGRPAPVVPEVSHIAATPTGGETLAPAEIAEMKEHLGFLRRYKDILRLKLNAAEDLLVNGQREPSERGVCRHLLGKVDRAVIDAAVAREPLRSDAPARARMLAGAIRVTADVGVLLAYLEALAHVRSRAEAAQAFGEVVRRIDFESLSPNRLARLLQVLIETFVDHERVQVLFSLLAQPSFRRAFDAATEAFPQPVADAFAPLRAVHARLVEDAGRSEASQLVTAGMEQVLAAPDPVLRGYTEELRLGMLEIALRPDVPAAVADRAAGVLLATLPHGGRTYARLAHRRAAQLLQRHADDRARVVLDELHRAQPGLRTAERWLAALDARRLGRIALEGGLPDRGRLAPGLWLDGQRTVWVRSAAAPEAERLATEAAVQTALALPGVAAVVERGVASGIPYVAVSAPGRPFDVGTAKVDGAAAYLLAAGPVRVLHAVALAGAVLPDAAPERFLFAAPAALVLADLDGVRRSDTASATRAHAALAAELVARIVSRTTHDRLPDDSRSALRRALDAADDLVGLATAVDRAALLAGRD
jgi:hypothetical protein